MLVLLIANVVLDVILLIRHDIKSQTHNASAIKCKLIELNI